MRKGCAFAMLILASVASGGCSTPWDRARCGWHFEIIKPPVIDTNTPVLVQSSGNQMSAHPMGTVSGPIDHGQYEHGVMPAWVKQRALQHIPAPSGTVADCGPPPHRGLTIEEWCRLMNEMKASRMPSAHQ